MLKSLIANRFDVEIQDENHIVAAHQSFFGTTDILKSTQKYFSKRLQEIVQDLGQGHTIFITYIFHTLIGYLVTHPTIDKEASSVLKKYLKSIRDERGGYFPIHEEFKKQFPKLGISQNTPIVSEIYSSYYGFWTNQLLGQDHTNDDIDGILTWLIACQQTSGLIYSREYSNTMEERRFESEKAAQLYYAVDLMVRLPKFLNDFDLEISLNDAREWVLSNFTSLRTVTARYFAFKALLLISPNEVCNLGIEELMGFLKDRLSKEDDGYYDYRLEDKFDESMSSRSYTSDDINSSHVFSSFYALALIELSNEICGGKTKAPNKAIRSLIEKSRNDDGGFGHHVFIKSFPTPFGPDTTDLETLLVTLLPLLDIA